MPGRHVRERARPRQGRLRCCAGRPREAAGRAASCGMLAEEAWVLCGGAGTTNACVEGLVVGDGAATVMSGTVRMNVGAVVQEKLAHVRLRRQSDDLTHHDAAARLHDQVVAVDNGAPQRPAD